MAQFTKEEKTVRRIEKRFSKGLVEYGLIEDGDKIQWKYTCDLGSDVGNSYQE